MKKIMEASLIVRFLTAVAGWLDRQWERSYISLFFAGREARSDQGLLGRLAHALHLALCRLFRALRLDRLLEGSVFKRTWFWMALTVFMAPIMPTMAVLLPALVSLGSLVLCYCCDRERRLTPSPVTKWTLGFAAVYMASTLMSTDLRGSLRGGMLTCAFVLFALAVLDTCRERRQAQQLLYIIVLSGTLVSLYGIAQAALGLESTESWVDLGAFDKLTLRVYATLENPNVLSEYLMLTTPLAAACVLNARTANGRLWGVLAAGSMLVCLALTYSRGGYLGLVFGMAVFLVMLDRRYLVLGFLALVGLVAVLPETLLARVTSIGTLSDSSTSYRVYIWMATLNLLKDYWMCGFGTGVAAFQRVYPRYSFNAVSAPHAHNLFLQMFCECGILGPVTLLGAILAWVRDLGRSFRGAGRRDQVVLAALMGSMAGFMVQSMTDHSFYNYRVTLMFWIVLGLGAAWAGIAGRGRDET